ncbi:hypothetical protein C8A03DRAFT_40825 [Achaetomium macrosporum]|uniref:Protein kinase domain-containing protein n=1 Tax=Achaetomium macrosporum TaxID=79813 RepID=A0AAN7HE91_9PEZI|nr:hypothetical protein C8A03DRAFT_40825 [Achaetomium macrosporum]
MFRSLILSSVKLSSAYAQFRLGTRRVSATGTICDHHCNVVHLRVLPSCIDRFLSPLRFLPGALRRMLQSRWPEWFLPTNIVLKREKVGWEEEFDNENMIYQRLGPIQGSIVPICYGEAECQATETTGTRALVLSDVGGISLHEDAAGGLDTDHVEAMLLEALRQLTSLGVGHGDGKLDNYRLVGNKDRIMVIDFDSSYIIEKEDPEYTARHDARFATQRYWLVHGGKKPSMML